MTLQLFGKHLNSLVPVKMESTKNAFGIKINEQIITNEQMIADHFNEFFINIASNLKQPLEPSHFEKLNNFINSKVTDDVSFDIPLINCTSVTSFSSSMDGTKSTGLNCIGPRLLKLALQFCPPL